MPAIPPHSHGSTASRLAHSVPGAQLLQLVELMQAWSITADELLVDTNLSTRALEEPQLRVSMDTYHAVVRRARELSGEPALGIFMGLHRRVSMYGFLGYAAMNAGSVREALELAVQFSSTISTAVRLSLHVEGDVAALRIEEVFDAQDLRDVAVTALVVGLCNIGRGLARHEFPFEAQLMIPQPHYFERFARLLKHMRFGQPMTQLVFDAKYLDLPVVTSDRAGLRLARQQVEHAMHDLRLDSRLVARVRNLVTTGEGVRSLPQVAKAMHMSARTLKRRLAAQGLTYTEMVEEERMQRASLLLRYSQLPLTEVSERLGYSTASNFARTFRRWTGMSPSEYRRAPRVMRP